MPVRILSQSEVVALLPMRECIDLMDATLRTLARGDAQLPLRTVLRLPDGGLFGVMPARLGAPASLGLKAIGVFPRNEGTRFDSHQGLVILFDPENGSPIAVLDASSITALRTAAVSGVATRALANPGGGGVLALLGSGVQARTHLEAMLCVRPVERVRVYSPNPERLAAFLAWARAAVPVPVEPAADPQAAVRGADLICTVTASAQPVVEGSWLSDGTHINAVGSSIPTARELDSAAIARSRLFADRLESARNEAGDYLIPLREGSITESHLLGELGDVLLGRIEGRRSAGEITLFKSLGIAVEDLAAAHYVLQKARSANIGIVAELGGLRP
jgi:ornithine cyclodeaminase